MMRSNIDVSGTGFTVLDRIYADGLAPVEALGGSCGNVLISLAMLDRTVAPVISIGQDDVGEQLLAEFRGAGADTKYISCRGDRRSPILAQSLNTEIGQHSFSFICPETNEEYPRYEPIGLEDVEMAGDVLDNCHVFFTDRVSEAIVEAMELAHNAGAVTYFEPSAIEDHFLFERALKATSILKFSSDRMKTAPLLSDLSSGAVLIVTYGCDGLELSAKGQGRLRYPAMKAPVVRDTCGSGDMLTVGIIDWLVHAGKAEFSMDQFQVGVLAGQRLAAANCSFLGARGLFSRLGAGAARRILNDEEVPQLGQFDLFDRVEH
jgi:fructokinase